MVQVGGILLSLNFEFLHLEIIKKTSFFLINRTSLTSFRSVIVQQQLLFILFYTKRPTRPYFNGVLSMYMDNIFLDWGGPPYFKTNVYSQYYMGSPGENLQLCLSSPYVCIWNNYFHELYDTCKFKRLKLLLKKLPKIKHKLLFHIALELKGCVVFKFTLLADNRKKHTLPKKITPPTFLTKTHNFFRSTIRLNSRIEKERTCLFLNGTKVFQKSQMARRCDFISVSSPFWEHMQCITLSSKLRKKVQF